MSLVVIFLQLPQVFANIYEHMDTYLGFCLVFQEYNHRLPNLYNRLICNSHLHFLTCFIGILLVPSTVCSFNSIFLIPRLISCWSWPGIYSVLLSGSMSMSFCFYSVVNNAVTSIQAYSHILVLIFLKSGLPWFELLNQRLCTF